MNEELIGWKLVKKYGKNWCSIFSAVKKIYREDKINWRRRGCGPMAVLESEHIARNYGVTGNDAYGPLYIVKCKYTLSKETQLYYSTRLLGKTVYKTQGKKWKLYRRAWTTWDGTIFADNIQLLETPKPIKEIN